MACSPAKPCWNNTGTAKLLWHRSAGGAALLAKFGTQLAAWRELAQSAILPDLFDQVLNSGYRAYLENEGEGGWNAGKTCWSYAAWRWRIPRTFIRLSGNVALVSDQDTLSDDRAAVTLLTLHAIRAWNSTAYIMGLMRACCRIPFHG